MTARRNYGKQKHKSNRTKLFFATPTEEEDYSKSNSLSVAQIKKQSESVYRIFCKLHNDNKSRRQLIEEQQAKQNFQRFGLKIPDVKPHKQIMFNERRKDTENMPIRINFERHRQLSNISNDGRGMNFSHVQMELELASQIPLISRQPLHHSNTYTDIPTRNNEVNQEGSNIRRQKTLVVKLPSVINSEPDSECKPDPFLTFRDYRTTIPRYQTGLGDRIASKLKSLNADLPRSHKRDNKTPLTQPKRETTTFSVVSIHENKSLEVPQIKVSKCQLKTNSTPNGNSSPIDGGKTPVAPIKKVEPIRKVDNLPIIGNTDFPKILPKTNEYKGSKLTPRTSHLTISRRSPAVASFSIAYVNQKRAIAQRRLSKFTLTKKHPGHLGEDSNLPYHFLTRRIDTRNTYTKDKIGKRLHYETDIQSLLKQKTALRIDRRSDTEFDFKLLTIEPWKRVPEYYKLAKEKAISFSSKESRSPTRADTRIYKTLQEEEDNRIEKDLYAEEEEQSQFEFIITNSLRPMQAAGTE